MKRPLLIALTALITLSIAQPHLLAEDGAHGGTNGPSTGDEPVKLGEAVKAPRVTQRYTDKGVTVDPVAIDIAPNGDIYVAEGSRAAEAAIDNRHKPLRATNGVIDDLKKTHVDDRLKQINMLIEKGHYPPDQFTKYSDRVRLVKDTDHDGKADTSTVFADNFNDPLDGIAAGVLYHDGKVYLTNIPNLWLLEDKDGDGDADKATEGERVSLSFGWGVRWTFFGHDMHGLIKGPDGRIYFSIGDRGYNVTTKEGKQLYGPDRGAVFRMWPDGSGLELYFQGLRNPQELAFDHYGNLFTGDNNSDGGDKARFAWLPEGGDAGWRQDVQSLGDRGPWNREQMWKPRDVEQFGLLQPAWIIPPIKNVGRGPSGLTHYPGTGDVFPSNGSFLMCDYPAGVRHVHVQPEGAFFKVVEDSKLPTEGSAITDVTWGYDGRLYLSDWGGGWRPNPNGYIKTMVNEAAHQNQAEQIAEVKQLFAQGFKMLTDQKLIELLSHTDQRVRIHAQWELAGRESESARDRLVKEWLGGKSERSRLHALWALGMQIRTHPKDQKYRGMIILEYFEQPDCFSYPILVAQAYSVLGDLKVNKARASIRNALEPDYLLKDHPQLPLIQYHAAIALGKVGSNEDIDLLLGLLDRNNNEDIAIRHAASYGLSLIGDAQALASEARTKGAAARLGAVLALRRLNSPLLAGFLEDEDPQVAAEAARGIYDKRVMEAMPALAGLSVTLPTDRMTEPVMRRVIEANVRLADQASAMRLGQLAGDAQAPEQWRLLAMTELNNWSRERGRDGVWGAWWPRPEQTMELAATAMLTHLPSAMSDPNEKIAIQARTLIQKHVSQSTPKELAQTALDAQEPEAIRLGTLQLLIEADRTLATQTIKQLLTDAPSTATIRIVARDALIQFDPDAAHNSYAAAINAGELIEQQDAIGKLAEGTSGLALQAIESLIDQLKRGELDPALRLDLVQAVASNPALPASLRLAVQQYVQQNQTGAENPFIRDASLAGGSADRGKDVFSQVCAQCHQFDIDDAPQGPNLSGIGAARDMDYLYTSVALPNADIVPGYANELGQSNMKAMNDVLSPMQMRDVLAYLASLTTDPAPAYQAQNLNAASVPQITKPGDGLMHVILLTGILLGIAASMVLILMGTILMNQLGKP